MNKIIVCEVNVAFATGNQHPPTMMPIQRVCKPNPSQTPSLLVAGLQLDVICARLINTEQNPKVKSLNCLCELFYKCVRLSVGALDVEMEGRDMLSGKQRHQLKHRELFLSRQVETLPATHIRGKCSVTLLNETESFLSYLNKDVSISPFVIKFILLCLAHFIYQC